MMASRNVKCFGAGRTGVVVVDWRGRVGEQVLAAESSVLIEAASMQATSGQPLNHALASPVVAGVESRASLGCEYPHRFDMQPRDAVTKPGYGAITPGTQYTARR